MALLKILGGCLLLVGLIAVVLAATGRKSVHAELLIDAPPDAIWSVITDPATYPAWNPIFLESDGRYAEGETISYLMKVGDSEPGPVTVTVKEIRSGEFMHQSGGRPWLLTYDHNWILRQTEVGTVAVQHEVYTGIAVWFFDPAVIQNQYQAGLESLAAHLGQPDQR